MATVAENGRSSSRKHPPPPTLFPGPLGQDQLPGHTGFFGYPSSSWVQLRDKFFFLIHVPTPSFCFSYYGFSLIEKGTSSSESMYRYIPATTTSSLALRKPSLPLTQVE